MIIKHVLKMQQIIFREPKLYLQFLCIFLMIILNHPLRNGVQNENVDSIRVHKLLLTDSDPEIKRDLLKCLCCNRDENGEIYNKFLGFRGKAFSASMVKSVETHLRPLDRHWSVHFNLNPASPSRVHLNIVFRAKLIVVFGCENEQAVNEVPFTRKFAWADWRLTHSISSHPIAISSIHIFSLEIVWCLKV